MIWFSEKGVLRGALFCYRALRQHPQNPWHEGISPWKSQHSSLLFVANSWMVRDEIQVLPKEIGKPQGVVRTMRSNPIVIT